MMSQAGTRRAMTPRPHCCANSAGSPCSRRPPGGQLFDFVKHSAMLACMVEPDAIAAVRRFNRFYTRQIGVLRRTYLDSPYSLGEMRVLYELSQRDQLTATDVGRAL